VIDGALAHLGIDPEAGRDTRERHHRENAAHATTWR
jgi:hypothetical protein